MLFRSDENCQYVLSHILINLCGSILNGEGSIAHPVRRLFKTLLGKTKISYHTLYLRKCDRGLNIPDIDAKIAQLKKYFTPKYYNI